MFKDDNLFKLKQKAFTYSKITIITAVLFSLLSATVIWSASKAYYDYQASEIFESNVQVNIDHIDKRMSMYANALRAGLGFFSGSDNVTREDWHDFVNALEIKTQYPGMQGIGFSKMLLPDEILQIEQKMQRDGFTEFALKPKGKREQYSSILYLEPMDKRNLKAIGYDMFSELNRREAMENARDTGLPSISAKIILLQEIDADIQAGTLMYLPMYKKSAKTDTIEKRREALVGFVYSAFRMNDLMSKIALEKSLLNFKIYDSKNMSEINLLYKSFKESSYVSKYNTIETLKINNRTWYISFSSTKKFDDSVENLYPLLISLMGLLVNLFLLFIILSLIKSRQQIQAQSIINEEQTSYMLNQSRMAQMGEMISMIAHQWRQPLGAIAATAIDLNVKIELEAFDLKQEKGREECKAYFSNELKGIQEFIKSLTSTIDDFRTFYKPNKKISSVHFIEPINKALNIIKASFLSDGIEIVNTCTTCDIKFNIHSNELMQVILNILKNSQDNFKEKEIKNPKITITCECNNHNKVTLDICDNGGGIPEDVLPNIFDPYFSTKDEKNGTGLGLYMSKTIVEEHHHGRLFVNNRDDGVCFTIELLRDNISEI